MVTKTIEEIAEELRGTCDSLSNVLERNEMDGMDNDLDFCRALDNIVFCCEECNWWCELSEMSETEMVCTDCDHG